MFDIKEITQKRKKVLVFAVLIVLTVSWSGVIDNLSKAYVDASTVQALAAYAVARIINGAVTLAASISISASLGIGFDIQPFQILDPINDLVEQYSSAMKFAISSLVIQKILVEAVSTLIFKLILTLFAVFFVISMYLKDGAYSFFLFRIFSFFAMIRFLIVFVVLLNGIVDKAFVDKNISPRMQEVEEVASQLENQTATSGSGLSEDERSGLIAMIGELESERNRLEISSDIIESERVEASQIVESKKIEVAEFEDSMGAIERLNVFSREEPYRVAREELDQRNKQLEEKVKEANEIKRYMAEVVQDIQNAEDLIEGGSVEEGWLSSARSKIASFRDMAKWERIKESVERIVPSILGLMAAFVFKTLIMPLVFLALFLKGFKYIWGVDPRRWIKEEYQGMRKID